MGKSEPTPQRFRRKAKDASSSSSASEQIPSSLLCAPSTADNLLCENLLDSNITSELHVPSPTQTAEPRQGLTAANGTCDEAGLHSSLNRDNGVTAAADAAPREHPDRRKNLSLSPHLPAELSGLSHSEITPLCTNQSLELSTCHVHKEDSLALVVFIYNSSDSDIQQIVLELESDTLEVQEF